MLLGASNRRHIDYAVRSDLFMQNECQNVEPVQRMKQMIHGLRTSSWDYRLKRWNLLSPERQSVQEALIKVYRGKKESIKLTLLKFFQ